MLLAEKLALVALVPDTGRPHGDPGGLDQAFVGLLTIDLALRSRLELRANILEVTDASPTRDALLDTALTAIAQRPKKAAVQFEAVSRAIVGAFGHVSTHVFDRLADDGGAVRSTHKVLGIAEKAWLPDAGQRGAVVAGVRQAASSTGDPGDAGILLAMLGPVGLMKTVFPDRGERTAAGDRAQSVIEHVPLAAETRYVIRNVAGAAAAAGAADAGA